MGKCVAKIDGKDELNRWVKVSCGAETNPGYRYCEEHKTRQRAVEERERNSLATVIDATEAFPQQEGGEAEGRPGQELVREQDATHKEAKIPLDQKSIYEKTAEALDRMIEWEEKIFNMVTALPTEEWRYTDKAGAEQSRAELGWYERAQDRVLRGVTAVAKLDIDAQSVNANKMLREMIKVCVTNTLTRMGMAQHEIEQARIILTEEFEKAANKAG